jgi:serine protease SohB
VENGLADGFGDLHSVIKARYGEKVRLKKFPVARRPLVLRLLGGAEEAAFTAIEERMAFARFGL